MIKIGVYDSHPLLCSALTRLIATSDDEFEAQEVGHGQVMDLGTVKTDGINIVVVCVHRGEEAPLEYVRNLARSYERARSIVMMTEPTPNAVTVAIRNGAKGIMATDADTQELRQGIMTVRGGFEYFSKSITDLLVGKYVDGVIAQDTRPESKPQGGAATLSARQVEILRLWGSNMSNKEIADKLFLSVRTVESHKNHIMQRLNLKTTVDIIRYGIRNNIIDL